MLPARLPSYCAALVTCALAATSAVAQPATQTTTTKGVGSVSTEQIKGEVVEVEGNNLLVTCAGSNTPTVVDSSCQPGLVIGCNSGSCQ